MDAIICDTSSLVRLFKVDALSLISLDFDQIFIPDAVYKECPESLRQKIDAAGFQKLSVSAQSIEKYGLGERAMLNIALERHIENVLTDDAKAIKEARRQGLTVFTALDLLIAGKFSGVVESVRQKLDELKAAGEFITPEAERVALLQAGELFN